MTKLEEMKRQICQKIMSMDLASFREFDLNVAGSIWNEVCISDLWECSFCPYFENDVECFAHCDDAFMQYFKNDTGLFYKSKEHICRQIAEIDEEAFYRFLYYICNKRYGNVLISDTILCEECPHKNNCKGFFSEECVSYYLNEK